MPAAAQAGLGDPLKAQDLREINQALYLLSEASHKIDQAERAGMDVAALRLRHEDVRTFLESIKRTYFPSEQ